MVAVASSDASSSMTTHYNQPAWGRRFVLGACLGLFGLQLGYLLVANTILWTRSIDRWVTGSTKGLSLKVQSGWTLWPGRVHVQGVELHFEDHNVQLSVALDSAVVSLALWQLPTKTFHLTSVRAQGVRFLLRHRVNDTEGIERRLALYPEIPGYPDPPLFEGPARPPLTDAEYNLWTIQLDDVDAAVKELWVLEYRFTGQGRAKGGFRLQPGRDARTDLCSLTLDGALHAGTQTVASNLSGRIKAQLDRHDPRRVTGAQIFKKISFDIDLRAELPDLDFTSLYTSTGGPEFRRGAGVVLLRAALSHGAWKSTTALHYGTESIAVSQAKTSAVGALSLDAKIVKPGIDSVVQLSIASQTLAMLFEGAANDIEAPQARDIRVVLAASADLAQPIRMTALHLRLKLDIPQLRWLNGPLDKQGLLGSGSALAKATLHWSEGKLAQGYVAIDAKDARFQLAARAVQVSGKLDARLRYDPHTGRGDAWRFAIELPEVAVVVGHARRTLPGGAHLQSERLAWRGLPPRTLRTRFDLNTDSIKALVPFVISSDLLRGLALAIFHVGKTHAIIEVDKTAAALELRLPHAQSGTVHVTGILKKNDNEKDACGWFFIKSASLNLGLVMQAGSTKVVPFVSNSWARARPTTSLACGPPAQEASAQSVPLLLTRAER
jgi:hypothetical protein